MLHYLSAIVRPMALTFNEGKSCDAVLRVLEAREGHARSAVRLPERERHPAPIELTCRIGDTLFALEHTGIEPFAGHVQMSAEADRLFRPIETMLAGKLPPDDTFQLGLPANALQGMKKKDLAQVHAALVAYVEAAAPAVPLAPYGRFLRMIQNVQPPGVPFAVRLDRFQTVVPPGRFMITHLTPEAGVEPSREVRIRAACAKKLPKLETWRKDAQARTVLVLEDNDIQLTNPARVYDALNVLQAEFDNWPDEIYLVSTIIENPWWVHALRVGDQRYYEMSEVGNCLTEFDPDHLVDVTLR
jgi:hypothetical protein